MKKSLAGQTDLQQPKAKMPAAGATQALRLFGNPLATSVKKTDEQTTTIVIN